MLVIQLCGNINCTLTYDKHKATDFYMILNLSTSRGKPEAWTIVLWGKGYPTSLLRTCFARNEVDYIASIAFHLFCQAYFQGTLYMLSSFPAFDLGVLDDYANRTRCRYSPRAQIGKMFLNDE